MRSLGFALALGTSTSTQASTSPINDNERLCCYAISFASDRIVYSYKIDVYNLFVKLTKMSFHLVLSISLKHSCINPTNLID